MSALEQMSLFVVPPPSVIAPDSITPEGVLLPPPEIPDCDWVAFIKANHRVPMVYDERKPWEYCGWLMHYRLLSESHPDIAPRWDYWAETMMQQKLLDEPIPQATFHDTDERQPEYKMVDKWIDIVHRLQGTWSSVADLMQWFLWGFADKEMPKPPKFSPELNEKLYREVNFGPLLLRPADYFGSWVSFHKGSWNPHAFFPTPMTVVHFMNQMVNGLQDNMRLKTVHDPCVGTGRFLLDASNYSLCLSGIDIDHTNYLVSRVNAYLYAPWMVRPFPETVTGKKPGAFGLHWGDSLFQIMTEDGLLSREQSQQVYDAMRPAAPPEPTKKVRKKKAVEDVVIQ